MNEIVSTPNITGMPCRIRLRIYVDKSIQFLGFDSYKESENFSITVLKLSGSECFKKVVLADRYLFYL